MLRKIPSYESEARSVMGRNSRTDDTADTADRLPIESLMDASPFREMCEALADGRRDGMDWHAAMAAISSRWLDPGTEERIRDTGLSVPALLYVAYRTVSAIEEALHFRPQEKRLETLTLRDFIEGGEGI